MIEVIQGIRRVLTPKDKFCLLTVVFLLCIGALMEIAGLGLLMPIVAAFSKMELFEQNAALRFFRRLFSMFNDKDFLLICCGLVVLLYIIKNLWLFVIMRIYTAFVYDRLSDIACRLYSGFLHSRYGYFADNGKIELYSVIQKTEQMCSMVLLPAMHMAVDVLTIVFISGMLLFSIPFIVLGCIALFSLGSLLIYLPCRKISWMTGLRMNELITRLNKISLYSFEDIKSVKIMGLEEYFSAKWSCERKDKSRMDTRFYMLGQVPRLVLETLAVFSALSILGIMLWRGVAVGTVILSFSLLIAAMSRLLPAINRINYSLNMIRCGKVIFKEIIDSLNFEHEDLGDLHKTLKFQKSIRVENLSFSYPGSGKKIIDNLSFEIKRNTSLAVVGPTGGGKSTLIDLLLGLYRPDGGTVQVDGCNIYEAIGAWRKLIGFVPQFIVLADASIAENVAVGVEKEKIDISRVRQVLRIAQLEQFADSLPEGLNTLIGENGMRLSGGQRQRLGIARALYRDPEIIIFDEATSALDNETEQALMDAVEQLHGFKTLIMVAHRLSTVEKCEQRIEIKPAGRCL